MPFFPWLPLLGVFSQQEEKYGYMNTMHNKFKWKMLALTIGDKAGLSDSQLTEPSVCENNLFTKGM